MRLLKITDKGVLFVPHLGIVKNFPRDINEDKFQMF